MFKKSPKILTAFTLGLTTALTVSTLSITPAQANLMPDRPQCAMSPYDAQLRKEFTEKLLNKTKADIARVDQLIQGLDEAVDQMELLSKVKDGAVLTASLTAVFIGVSPAGFVACAKLWGIGEATAGLGLVTQAASLAGGVIATGMGGKNLVVDLLEAHSRGDGSASAFADTQTIAKRWMSSVSAPSAEEIMLWSNFLNSSECSGYRCSPQRLDIRRAIERVLQQFGVAEQEFKDSQGLLSFLRGDPDRRFMLETLLPMVIGVKGLLETEATYYQSVIAHFENCGASK